MEANMKFYKCKVCGKIIAIIEDTGTPTVCCNEEMERLIPGTTDGAHEKHIPVVTKKDCMFHVQVGSVEHPMTKEHYIQWIAIETNRSCQLKKLKPQENPTATFTLSKDERFMTAYAYCNLHLLWKSM